MKCPLAHHDAAYLLGALSPAERREFEDHLPGCEACRAAIGELAGLTGLLARVDAKELELLDADPETPAPPAVPTAVLPALLATVRLERRRRLLVTALGLAASVALVGGLGYAVGQSHAPASGQTPAVVGAAPQTMAAGESYGVTGNLSLTTVARGTRLDLNCEYPVGSDAASDNQTYSLVVHTLAGATERVATWKGLPGHTMSLAGATATDRADIARVEVVAADGDVVLSLST
ncbi:zf-HC2 domain-containing protein [Micrococcales bacterium 31B]|nr:zf-HC2 domain-containing protein [Micrococcales bacterium 31B]